ncbi:MAG TPA: undecaprenyl-diphosphate phosphatase [Candidatus Avamphibacillus sp.]|nr:undecaprenyl-diphosphate phosphatase [Candidatus Avamphibacillus sp.]
MNAFTSLWIIIKYIFLGIVQGITEPLPISSSGHVVVFQKLFAIEIEGLSFEIIVNTGSLIAVLIIYRKDILRLLQNGTRYIITKDMQLKQDFNFIIYLLVATMITGIIGLLLEDFISSNLSSVTIVGFTLLITAIALWIIRNLKGYKNDEEITIKDAVIVGLAQAVALVPGISRSGATIVASMLLGMERDTALRFSFLLYVPVSLGVSLLSIRDIVNDPYFNSLSIPYIIAFLASLVASFYALKWFINIMKKGKLKYFSLYCFIVGILIILFL